MKIAIFGISEVSQAITNIINQFYNPFFESRLGEPVKIVAYAVRGGGNTSQCRRDW